MAVDRVLSQLGIATKAGLLVSGEFACEEAIKNKKGFLCIVATDASDNTKKSFSDSCKYYGIKYVEYASKISLGHAIGKEYRATVVVCDQRLSLSILDKMSL